MNSAKIHPALFVATGIALCMAWAGPLFVIYWGIVCANSGNYHIAEFQVLDAYKSNPQKNFNRFWIFNGLVEGHSERLSVPMKANVRQPPFAAGEKVKVRYNPAGSTITMVERSLRVLTIDDYAAAGRNLVLIAAGCFGPGVFVGLLWLVRRLRQRGFMNAPDKYRGAIQICAIVGALACTGCEHNQAAAKAGLEDFASNLKMLYEHGDTNALFAQVLTNGVPPALLEPMNQVLLLPFSFGKVEVNSSKVFPFSEYKPTTGIPGVYEGKKLRWVTMPTHFVVLETILQPSVQAEGVKINTKFKLEFPVAPIKGRWLIIGPAYSD